MPQAGDMLKYNRYLVILHPRMFHTQVISCVFPLSKLARRQNMTVHDWFSKHFTQKITRIYQCSLFWKHSVWKKTINFKFVTNWVGNILWYEITGNVQSGQVYWRFSLCQKGQQAHDWVTEGRITSYLHVAGSFHWLKVEKTLVMRLKHRHVWTKIISSHQLWVTDCQASNVQ